MTAPNKALSVRAPWWWLILHGGKDIENRDWPTNYRGTVLIHASKWWRTIEVLEDMSWGYPLAQRHCGRRFTAEDDIRPFGGCIVGMVDIVGCVSASDSPWFFGDYGFHLADPVAFREPIPCKGALGFFTVPPDVMERVRAQVGGIRP